jgi:CDP-glucose 4,6-dehydratase
MIDPSFWKNRRVLLTGHTGFKGSWLLFWLHKLGADIWCFALEADSDPNLFRLLIRDDSFGNAVHYRQESLANLNSLKEWVQLSQPDVVFHLAAQSLVRRSYIDPLGTWNTNVNGSLHLLEALKPLQHPCAVVMITTDKVYENREWCFGYREVDALGGHDPYSASKAAAELAILSWRKSFCGFRSHQTSFLRIATARAGNVIGGGDWAVDRIVPDSMRALADGTPINVRNPTATRPWQHVLEPLSGYLQLAQALFYDDEPPCEAFNFGPCLSSNRKVSELVSNMLIHWQGTWLDNSDFDDVHEAQYLHLQIDKAKHRLGWEPRWDFYTTVKRTVLWYKALEEGDRAYDCCLSDILYYLSS